MKRILSFVLLVTCGAGLAGAQSLDWTSKTPSPVTMYDGGQLVWCCTDTLVLFQGNTYDYYIFNIASDSWTTSHSLGGYYPQRGAAAIPTRADTVYLATGGAGTAFIRLLVRAGTVQNRTGPPVLVGAGGAGCWAGGDTIFMVAGNATTSFCKYSITGNNWTTGTALPGVPDYGAALCWAGGDTLYALRGGGTRQFWAYSLSTATWSTKSNVPAVVGAGGSLVWNRKTGAQSKLYAIPGAGSNAAWVYDVATGAWSDAGPLPVAVPCSSTTVGPLATLDARDGRMQMYVANGDSWFLRGAEHTRVSLPLDESFEGGFFPPAGWQATDTVVRWNHWPWVRRQAGTHPNVVPYDGAWMASWPAYQRGYTWSRLRTPHLDAGPDYTAVKATFRMYQDNGGTVSDSLYVEYSTDGVNYATVGGFPRYSTVNGWYEKNVMVTTAVRDTFYVALRGRGRAQVAYNFYVDSIRVYAVPYPDVGATAITAPGDTVLPGQLVFPTATVRNLGTTDTSFYVKFRIGAVYTDSQPVASLAPTDSATVGFAPWTSVAGSYSMKCYTTLGNDMNRANDTVARALFVASLDAAALRIVSPTGTVDSGASASPQAKVRNLGNVSTSFPVVFRIGSLYADTQQVSNLNPGDSAALVFDSWTALQRGAIAVKCSTLLDADLNHANDALTGSVTVRVRDVGCIRVVAPAGAIDSGANVTPQAWVRNFGTTAEAPSALMRIGGSYANSQTAPTIQPGDSALVSFASWLASPNGTFAVRCSTTMAGDANPDNNRAEDSAVVTASRPDVATIWLGPPSGTVDSGVVIAPEARVRNIGNRTASFPAVFTIGAGYHDTVQVTGLAPGDSQSLLFRNWTALARGTQATGCTTALVGDANHANDSLSGSVDVRVIDATATSIVAPVGTVDSGTVVVPRATVRNNGTAAAVIPVRLTIADFYTDDTMVTLGAGVIQTVSFDSWTATELGTHTVSCTTMLAGDMNLLNDLARDTVRVIPYVGVEEPAGESLLARTFALGPIAPNLFHGRTVISFALPRSCRVSLGVYDASGQLVRTLVAGEVPAGFHRTVWTGSGAGDRPLGPGIYFCRLEAPGFISTRKLTKLE